MSETKLLYVTGNVQKCCNLRWDCIRALYYERNNIRGALKYIIRRRILLLDTVLRKKVTKQLL